MSTSHRRLVLGRPDSSDCAWRALVSSSGEVSADNWSISAALDCIHAAITIAHALEFRCEISLALRFFTSCASSNRRLLRAYSSVEAMSMPMSVAARARNRTSSVSSEAVRTSCMRPVPMTALRNRFTALSWGSSSPTATCAHEPGR